MDELRRIDLNLLLALHALLTERHVTRAAVRLHKSQPAVSHSLAQLRERFSDQLLIRRDGYMALTAKAQALIRPLEAALLSLNGLLGEDDFAPATARARLRLSLSDYAAKTIFPSVVRRVRTEAPGIELAISQASREAMHAQLSDGELDLALGIFPSPPEEILVEDLFPDRFVCVADVSALPADGQLSFEDWLARPHVMLALRPDANDEIEKTLGAKGLRRHIALALPHWTAAVQMLEGTDLILTIAKRALIGVEQYPTLRCFDPPLILPEIAYQQAWHVRKDQDPALRWLRRCFVEAGQLMNTGGPSMAT
ncbi:LysR family transcriptional regulator [Burkholderia lata]|uniref:LysR family transcriptional regulator n=1 Tax=Burkholderia lata (strain ATCC 17760 / DSM 23089 / LMG 22485 / NCIMB 9086 / R18194 / 383) TaxID=482957 RepID=A0A6P2KGV0_BURL3|nr:LysR family transcriptional regulator [Burkholderia lata]VWB56750.1 LysR family transcriptional regulator [Burkholderia lata]